jgi:hypothetical protein
VTEPDQAIGELAHALDVHRNANSGSPRVQASTRRSRSSTKSGSVRQRAFARRRSADPPTPRVAPGLELCDPLADRVFGDRRRACNRQDPTPGPPNAPPLPPTTAADAHQAHPPMPTPGTAHDRRLIDQTEIVDEPTAGRASRALSMGAGGNGSPRCRSRSYRSAPRLAWDGGTELFPIDDDLGVHAVVEAPKPGPLTGPCFGT